MVSCVRCNELKLVILRRLRQHSIPQTDTAPFRRILGPAGLAKWAGSGRDPLLMGGIGALFAGHSNLCSFDMWSKEVLSGNLTSQHRTDHQNFAPLSYNHLRKKERMACS